MEQNQITITTMAYGSSLRLRLQTLGRNLLRDASTAFMECDGTESLLVLHGRITEYITVRAALEPDIASDGYTSELVALQRSIVSRLTAAGHNLA